jgi:uncharacterized sulfatase
LHARRRRGLSNGRTLLAALCVAAGITQVCLAQTPPNVVLIIGDDVGWPDHGFMPSPQTLPTNMGPMSVQAIVQTPNLDAIAASGVVFRNGYSTASICHPAHRTLLSAEGLHSYQWDALRQGLDSLPRISSIPFREEVQYFRTLPRELGRLGCKSWEGGKHWEGTYQEAGFTHGLATSIGGFNDPVGADFGRTGWDTAACGSTGAPGVACPALAPFRAFLDSLQGECFFAWVAPELPHVPYDAPAAYRQHYQQLGLSTDAVNYLANVTWLDQVVGEVVSELDARGLLEQTLIIYLSDNGWGLGFQTFAGQGKGKGTLYDLGFRTPIVFQWPGHVPDGAVHDDLVSLTDIVPTIYDYMGADSVPGQQGTSLRSRIEGGPPLDRTELIGSQYALGEFLRTDTWRYLRFASDGHEELYRIDNDPFEQVNLAAANPALLTTFEAHVDQWLVDRYTPPADVEITGQIFDRTSGAPLPGARVQLYGMRLNAITGPDGSFRMGPVPLDYYAMRRDRGLTDVWALGGPDPIVLPAASLVGGLNIPAFGTLVTPTTATFASRLEGTLADTLGAPLAGQTVKLSARTASGRVTVFAITQADGSYRAENLPAGLYRVKATAPPLHRRVALRDVAVGDSVRVHLDLLSEAL